MGEVYRAQDARLNRTVAIKILPEHLSSDGEQRRRFQHEARAISSLSHPKICTLLDVGEQDGLHYLVLEYIEGQTLAERISKGPLPVPEALSLAAEIAEALAAAHHRGLIHRDLKPGNVMLTKTGLKLLDFGLARSFHDTSVDTSIALTATSPMTEAGAIVGTLQYMAPEQIEGKPTDARTDIFALGAVLYEMLTGRRAFRGESQGAVIAAILKEDPSPVDALVPEARIAQRCLSQCLARDPHNRWQSAQDLMRELRWLAEQSKAPTEAQGGTRTGSKRGSVMLTGMLTSLGVLLGLVVGRTLFVSSPEVVGAPVHTDVNLAAGTRLNGWASPVVAISQDGSAIAYVADGSDGTSRLYIRRLDSPDATLVPGSETAEAPFFSPDGRWLGFAVGVSAHSGRSSELMKYSLDTGLTQSITPLRDFFGGVWREDGEILFVDVLHAGLWAVPAEGGTPRNILATFKVDGHETRKSIMFPTTLPDGESVIVTDVDHVPMRLFLVDLTTGDAVDLGIDGTRAFIKGKDRFFYTDPEGTLIRMSLGAGGRPSAGAGVAVLDGIARTRFSTPVLDLSDNGTLVYCRGFVRGSRIMPSELVHLDASGSTTILPFEPQLIYRGISASPSGDRLAASLMDGNVWIYDVDRGTRTKLPAVPGTTGPWTVSWSPNGDQVSFSQLGSGNATLYRQPANGSAEPVLLETVDDVEIYAGSWTPDGQGIVYVQNPPGEESADIRMKPLQKGSAAQVLVDGVGMCSEATVSPDGRWLAFDSAITGDWEVYAHDLSGSSDRIVVSAGGGQHPIWSRAGDELYYHSAGRIMAVRVPPAGEERFGRPRIAVETDIDPLFSIDPKGGFFGYRPVPGVGIHRSLKLIQNWEGLRE